MINKPLRILNQIAKKVYFEDARQSNDIKIKPLADTDTYELLHFTTIMDMTEDWDIKLSVVNGEFWVSRVEIEKFLKEWLDSPELIINWSDNNS